MGQILHGSATTTHTIRAAIKRSQASNRDAGAHLLFLPPYSPDLNPIEMMFAKLKALVRKAEARTVEETWRRIGTLLNAFPPNE